MQNVQVPISLQKYVVKSGVAVTIIVVVVDCVVGMLNELIYFNCLVWVEWGVLREPC